jgi:hypothetical protein
MPQSSEQSLLGLPSRPTDKATHPTRSALVLFLGVFILIIYLFTVVSRLTDGTVTLLKAVNSFIMQSALQDHNQFLTEFSGKWDLVLPL